MIEINNLSKSFSVQLKKPGILGSLKSLIKREYVEKHALKNVSLKIESGEIIGLIGANGAGKTTLVKILSGIISKGSGNVDVNGFDPWKRNHQFKKMLSLIMGQKAQLWWDLPASDGFLLLKEIYQIPQKRFDANIKNLSTRLDVVDILNTPVRKLSLGERMKMELIAALLHDPKVIFLDEPTIGLDLSSQKAVRNFINEYRKERETTIILTSHYMKDIEQLCSRIALMNDGEIIYDGGIDEIRHKFASDSILSFETSTSLEAIEKLSSCEKVTVNGKRVEILLPKNSVSKTLRSLLTQFELENINTQDVDIETVIEKYLLNEKS